MIPWKARIYWSPVHLIQRRATLVGSNSQMLDTWPWSTQNNGSRSACRLPSVPFSYFFLIHVTKYHRVPPQNSLVQHVRCLLSVKVKHYGLDTKCLSLTRVMSLDTWSLTGNAVLGTCGPSMMWDGADESRSLGSEPWRWHRSPVLVCVV